MNTYLASWRLQEVTAPSKEINKTPTFSYLLFVWMKQMKNTVSVNELLRCWLVDFNRGGGNIQIIT